MPKICKNWTFHILFCWFICFQQTDSYKRKKTESFWCFQGSNYIIASLFLLIFMRDVNIWFIAELAERSPMIIQNSSNLSSRKNLDVRPYDRKTVRPYKVLLLICVVNCTAGTPTPRLFPVVQWSVHSAPRRTTRVLVLAGARRCALKTCGKNKCEFRF